MIFTGTPGGVGMAMNPPRLLKPGDRVRVKSITSARLKLSRVSKRSPKDNAARDCYGCAALRQSCWPWLGGRRPPFLPARIVASAKNIGRAWEIPTTSKAGQPRVT